MQPPLLAEFPTLDRVLDRAPLAVSSDTSVLRAIILMNQAQCNYCELIHSNSASLDQPPTDCVLVVEGTQLVGIFTEQDVVRLTAAGTPLAEVNLAEVMTPNVITLTASNARNAFTPILLLQQYQIHHLPVLDDQGQLHGVVTPGSVRRVLQPTNLLKLKRVEEQMTTQVIHASELSSVLDLAQCMANHCVNCVVIVETQENNGEPAVASTPPPPIGIVTARDILQFQVLELDLGKTQAQTVMSTPVFSLNPKDSLWEAYQEMQRRQVQQLVVVGEQGELLGMISQTDFLQAFDPVEMAGVITTLQQQVEEQTAELAQINTRLQQEINQRKRVEIALQQQQLQAMRDISDRKWAEVELKRMNAALSNAMEGISQLDTQGRYVMVNQAYAKMLGYQPEEMIGMPWQRTIHTADLEKMITAYQHMLSTGKVEVETRGIRKNGTIFYKQIVMIAVYSEQQQLLGHYCFMKDISERKRDEETIREQAALINISPNAIFVCDLDYHVLFWSKGAERLYGWTAAEMLDKNCHELLCKHVSPQLEIALKTTVEQGVWQGEFNKVTQSGKELIVASCWTLVHDKAGQPQSILSVDTNITEQKQLEGQFLRAQRLESVGTLASGIAHDMNNILSPILAAAQLLPRKFPTLDNQSRHLLKIVEDNAKRGADLVNQILSFARGVEGKQIPLQVGHILVEIQQIVKSTFPKFIKIDSNIPKDLWHVSADATQLHQVLMNLCINARDAMPNGGNLSLIVANFLCNEAYAQTHLESQAGPYVVITIADTGTGIPPDVLDRIFEPFFTTKEPGRGTGLGLSTVLGIVQNHGGFVSVSTEVGKGSQFRVYLPAIQESQVQPVENLGVADCSYEICFERRAERASQNKFHSRIKQCQNLELLTGHGEWILVVDDEAPIRDTTKALLETYHYNVLTASDGIEAIAFYIQHQHEISAVLMDIMMPSMDGCIAMGALQKINPQVKIIGLSGLAAHGKLAQAAGVKSFLTKPYTTYEVLQTLHQLLRNS